METVENLWKVSKTCGDCGKNVRNEKKRKKFERKNMGTRLKNVKSVKQLWKVLKTYGKCPKLLEIVENI